MKMKKFLPSKLELKPYKHEGSSGVKGYQSGADFIILEFENAAKDRKRVYLYNYEVPGKKHVETMKKLALEGKGLTGYKNKYFMFDYYAHWDEKKHKFVLKNKTK
jgi:hypothetical protein